MSNVDVDSGSIDGCAGAGVGRTGGDCAGAGVGITGGADGGGVSTIGDGDG